MRFKFLFLFLMIFPLSLFAQNVSDITGDSIEEVEGRGLLIRTRPAGARVFIDGVERGQTPLSISTLGSGEYSLRLVKDGYKDRRLKITLPVRSRLVVSLVMDEAEGQVLLNIRPVVPESADDASGAAFADPVTTGKYLFTPLVIVGGETLTQAAIAPGTLLTLPVGFRTIQVRAFGWEDAAVTVYVRENRVQTADIYLSPAVFNIGKPTVSRSRFNPGNSGALGTTEFRFEVSAPGTGTLTVRNSAGRPVYAAELGAFETWSQSVEWKGRGSDGNPLPEGIYTAYIEAESSFNDDAPPVRRIISLETEIDASINIYPLSLSGGISGLMFVPVPAVLPRGSFQIEAGLLFGKVSAFEPAERPFTGLPFAAGLRFSLLDTLETSAVLNASPKFGGEAAWGISGAVKWVFLHGEADLPLSMAAGFSFAWAGSGGEAPLSPGRGAVLYLPLSWRFNAITALFSPAIRWIGPSDPVPRLLLSAGALYQASHFTAGLSLRPEFDFSPNTDNRFSSPGDRIILKIGGEIKFYPPPSSLVFSLLGGAWFRGAYTGGFGGVGIGIIY
ncbi:MAG: PEGA domain-containing protein [Treponema sp.]|jgi:hypothetical protein|nr:PEGA domain-containing protein [Treponema sp.]